MPRVRRLLLGACAACGACDRCQLLSEHERRRAALCTRATAAAHSQTDAQCEWRQTRWVASSKVMGSCQLFLAPGKVTSEVTILVMQQRFYKRLNLIRAVVFKRLFSVFMLLVDADAGGVVLVYLVLHSLYSVSARLRKGQGAKEIGHDLAREQPKFGHNLVRKRHKIGHTFTRERPKFGLVGD